MMTKNAYPRLESLEDRSVPSIVSWPYTLRKQNDGNNNWSYWLDS
jgi:hypothetical protein